VNGSYYRLDTLDVAPPGLPEQAHHALIAGAVGGYFIWGRYSAVNYQIVLYLASRVMVAMYKRLLERGGVGSVSDRTYRLGAAAVWGIVMMLFEQSPEVLHPSLKSSMDEIYRFGLPPRESSEVNRE
jgi:peroxisomal membrane protein 4